MANTSERSKLVRLSRKAQRAHSVAEGAQTELSKALKDLVHEIISATQLKGAWNVSNASIMSRRAGMDDRWDDRFVHHDLGSEERPLVGIVKGYELTDGGYAHLIVICPNDSWEYRFVVEYFAIDVLDGFPPSKEPACA